MTDTEKLEFLKRKKLKTEKKMQELEDKMRNQARRQRTRSLVAIGAGICSKSNEQAYGVSYEKLHQMLTSNYQLFMAEIFTLSGLVLIDTDPDFYRKLVTESWNAFEEKLKAPR